MAGARVTHRRVDAPGLSRRSVSRPGGGAGRSPCARPAPAPSGRAARGRRRSGRARSAPSRGCTRRRPRRSSTSRSARRPRTRDRERTLDVARLQEPEALVVERAPVGRRGRRRRRGTGSVSAVTVRSTVCPSAVSVTVSSTVSPCTVSVSTTVAAPSPSPRPLSAHARAAPAASRPMAPTSTAVRRGGETWRVTVVVAGCGGAETTVAAVDGAGVRARRSSATSSAQLACRSSGCLARPRAKTVSSATGRPGSIARGEGGASVGVRCSLGGRVVALERPATGEELERHASQRVAVAGRRARLASRLLRRHVAGRAEHGPGGGQRVVAGRARDAEVGDAHRVAVGDEQVGGLHVAVDDPAGVGSVERRGRLLEPSSDWSGAPGRRAAGRRPCHPGRTPSR